MGSSLSPPALTLTLAITLTLTPLQVVDVGSSLSEADWFDFDDKDVSTVVGWVARGGMHNGERGGEQTTRM